MKKLSPFLPLVLALSLSACLLGRPRELADRLMPGSASTHVGKANVCSIAQVAAGANPIAELVVAILAPGQKSVKEACESLLTSFIVEVTKPGEVAEALQLKPFDQISFSGNEVLFSAPAASSPPAIAAAETASVDREESEAEPARRRFRAISIHPQ